MLQGFDLCHKGLPCPRVPVKANMYMIPGWGDKGVNKDTP